MLRQALDEAYSEQRSLSKDKDHPPRENTPLEPGTHLLAENGPSSHVGRSVGYDTIIESNEAELEGGDLDDSSSSGDDEDEDDDDIDYLLKASPTKVPKNLPAKIWNGVKSAFMFLANVENIWDEGDPPQFSFRSQSLNRQPETVPERCRHFISTRQKQLVVLFWFVVLAVSYVGERSTFKLLVDKAGPFRLFSIEMVTAAHALFVALGILLQLLFRSRQDSTDHDNIPLGIPILDVSLMALFDTATLLLVFITGVHVPPTLTVLLVQFTLPLTAFLTQFVHEDGRFNFRRQDSSGSPESSPSTIENLRGCDRHQSQHQNEQESSGVRGSDESFNSTVQDTGSDFIPSRSYWGTPLRGWGGLSVEHVAGSLVISLAVLLALVPAIYCIIDPQFFVYADRIPVRTAFNTLLYASSCIPAAASQLYKEHVFCFHKQPVNMAYLDLLLSCFQFMFVLVLSPLAFTMQGFGTSTSKGKWTDLYPSSELGENFLDGLRCFFGQLDEDDQLFKYQDNAHCNFTLGLVLLHAFSIIAVGFAVDMIVNAGTTKVMYRGVSAGIVVAVLCMRAYDENIPDFNYGAGVDALNLVCLILLIVGSEIYHRTSLQGSTFDTIFPEIPNFGDEAFN